ncbi:sugar transferase [Flavobacteriaceae bacterium Ap0902]|nr:sugar transferase [Flavobacteriaceae bacterium Ap0902]
MKISKIIFDYLLAIILLIALFIPLFICWVVASIQTGQNGIFVQKRIGQFGHPFLIYKIRTMRGNYNNPVTTENSHDITNSGKFFIQYKIDELPQLFNILNGTMSFVGPRPDVPGYADLLEGEDRIILTVKPGITGPAQIKYRNENKILSESNHPKKLNDEVLWPDKVCINKEYVKNWSFFKDIQILYKTFF